MKNNETPAYLVLEDGTIFKGRAAGKIGTTTGEICFNTGMTGYQEIFTDPSYTGQIMVTTNAHIGNYGVKDEDTESFGMKISGLVCKNFTNLFSRQLANGSIQDYFETENMVGIDGVDTRAIVRHIRDKGAMNAIISSKILDEKALLKAVKEVPSMSGLEISSQISTKEPYEYGEATSKYKVAVLDLGVKRNILKCLADRNCFLKVFPAKTKYAEIAKWNPDGLFLSNGPGDPGAMDYAVATTQSFLDNNTPIFGICLGHQILARAMGISTYKMHHGHRGANHPVLNVVSERGEITTQNHGFGVDKDELQKAKNKIEATHINLNDDTVEGIRIKDKPAFSVQYHPESTPGPHDSRYLFDEFLTLIKAHK